MYLYQIFSEVLHSDEFGDYVGYGIMVIGGDAVVASVPDISADKRMVENLCRACTKLRLCPRQLGDVVEDSIV